MVHYSFFNLLFIIYVLTPNNLSEMFFWISWYSMIGFIKVFSVVVKERTKYVSEKNTKILGHECNYY